MDKPAGEVIAILEQVLDLLDGLGDRTRGDVFIKLTRLIQAKNDTPRAFIIARNVVSEEIDRQSQEPEKDPTNA